MSAAGRLDLSLVPRMEAAQQPSYVTSRGTRNAAKSAEFVTREMIRKGGGGGGGGGG